MHALNRRLLTLLTLLSLAAFVAVAALWVRGWYIADTVVVRRADPERHVRTTWLVQSSSGRVMVFRYRNFIRERFVFDFFEQRTPWRALGWSTGPPSSDVPVRSTAAQWHFLGFGWAREVVDKPDYTDNSRAVVVPYWFLAVLTGWLPGAWGLRFAGRVRRRWREWRREVWRGRCAKCGYDLRATPGRCPECGTAAAGADAVLAD